MTLAFVIDYLSAFGLMAALDFVWAKYTFAVAHRMRHQSAAWAVLITLLNGLITFSYIGLGPTVLVPVALGAWVGTYLSMREPTL